MSLYVKKVPGGEYVYFQTYRDGKRKEEYLGRKGDPIVLEKAIELFLEHQDYELGQFLSKLERIGYEVPGPNEVRRRLQEAQRAKVSKEEIWKRAAILLREMERGLKPARLIVKEQRRIEPTRSV